MLMIAAGCEVGDDATSLRQDPVFKMAQGVLPSGRHLASRPTISRLENMAGVHALLPVAGAMVDLYCTSFRQVPKRIVLDIDDMFDAVNGSQRLRLFNGHHDEYGFRLRLIEIAARVVEMRTQIRVHLAIASPAQPILRVVLGRIACLATRATGLAMPPHRTRPATLSRPETSSSLQPHTAATRTHNQTPVGSAPGKPANPASAALNSAS